LKIIGIVMAIVVISLSWMAAPLPVFSESGQIHWYGYQEGIERMKTEKKKGFLHFYTTWCKYCKVMDANTFANARVIGYLNENFISMRINAEVDTAVARIYGANKFPDNWFLTEEAANIGSRPGYIPPEDLLNLLTYVHSNDYKNITFNAFLEKQKGGSPQKPGDTSKSK